MSYCNYTNSSKILYIIEGSAEISLRCIFVGSLCNYKSKYTNKLINFLSKTTYILNHVQLIQNIFFSRQILFSIIEVWLLMGGKIFSYYQNL